MDDLAVALCDGMSRRQALRLMGATVLGIALASSIRPRSSPADDACGAQVPYYSGCDSPVPADPPRGSVGIENSGCALWGFLPTFGALGFDLDCARLATCYTSCGEDKATCDGRFYGRMTQTCNQLAALTPAGQLAQITCLASASVNFALLNDQAPGSPGDFNTIQADRCDCCDCPGGCPDGTACCGGGCVDVTNDPGSCGGCGQVCSGDWPGGYACCNGICTELGTTDNCTDCGDQCTCDPDAGSPACYDDACNCF